MIKKIGFDTDLYIEKQIYQIQEMLKKPGDRFYMEIGGKLIQDRHAARVLPGYREDARFEVVQKLGLMGEILVAVSAKDIIRGRIRGDFKITYDKETLRTIEELRQRGLVVKKVVITMLDSESQNDKKIASFENDLRAIGILVSRFFSSENHKSAIFSAEDLERNPFIEYSSRMVSVISPGGGSGKFGVCISQLYHEMKHGVSPRYFSLGAFPIYELPADHLVNLAYLSAMADTQDFLKNDPNQPNSLLTEREIKNFNILKQLANNFKEKGQHLREITSATDMCVNALCRGIVDEEEVKKEAAAEIARRYIRYKFEYEKGQESKETLERAKQILLKL